jgi:MinD-like ATPase involved in chromosome partitioning or flagellar assembly
VTAIIWCTPGRSDEADLISAVSARGLTVARRCIEAADLFAAASLDEQAALVIDVATPRLSTDTALSLPNRESRALIVLVDNDDALARARSWNLRFPVLDTRTLSTQEAIVERIVELISLAEDIPQMGVDTDSAVNVNTRSASDVVAPASPIVTVWGPHGAPGRSTIALGLAEQWASSGERVCLIDADTIAPSLDRMIGMTEDVSGLLIAARYADQGALDQRSLASACRRLSDSLWLMTGIGTPDRWTQARPSALDRVWKECSAHFDRVVIDVGPLLRTEEIDDPFHGIGMQRDAATLSALRSSSAVVAVTRPDAIGATRLVEDLAQFPLLAPATPIDVVVNRVPRKLTGVQDKVRDVLKEAGLSMPLHVVNDDPGIATCVQRGALLSEVSATMKSRRRLRKLTGALAA